MEATASFLMSSLRNGMTCSGVGPTHWRTGQTKVEEKGAVLRHPFFSMV